MSSDDKNITAYLTDSVLSKDIRMVRGEIDGSELIVGSRYSWRVVRHSKGDWHLTEEAALRRSLEVLSARRSELSKQMAKLNFLERLWTVRLQQSQDFAGGSS